VDELGTRIDPDSLHQLVGFIGPVLCDGQLEGSFAASWSGFVDAMRPFSEDAPAFESCTQLVSWLRDDGELLCRTVEPTEMVDALDRVLTTLEVLHQMLGNLAGEYAEHAVDITKAKDRRAEVAEWAEFLRDLTHGVINDLPRIMSTAEPSLEEREAVADHRLPPQLRAILGPSLAWLWEHFESQCHQVAAQAEVLRIAAFPEFATRLKLALGLAAGTKQHWDAFQATQHGLLESDSDEHTLARQAAADWLKDVTEACSGWLDGITRHWPDGPISDGVRDDLRSVVKEIDKLVSGQLLRIFGEMLADPVRLDEGELSRCRQKLIARHAAAKQAIRKKGTRADRDMAWVLQPAPDESPFKPARRRKPAGTHHRQPVDVNVVNEIELRKSDLDFALQTTPPWVRTLKGSEKRDLRQAVEAAAGIESQIRGAYSTLQQALTPSASNRPASLDDSLDEARLLDDVEEAGARFIDSLLEPVETLTDTIVESLLADEPHLIEWVPTWAVPAKQLLDALVGVIEPVEGSATEQRERIHRWYTKLELHFPALADSVEEKGKQRVDQDDTDPESSDSEPISDEALDLKRLRETLAADLEEIGRAARDVVEAIAPLKFSADVRQVLVERWTDAHRGFTDAAALLDAARSIDDLSNCVERVEGALATILHGTAGSLAFLVGPNSPERRAVIRSCEAVREGCQHFVEDINAARQEHGLAKLDIGVLPSIAELVRGYQLAQPPIPDEATMERIRQANATALMNVQDGTGCPYHLLLGPYPLFIIGHGDGDPVVQEWLHICDFHRPLGIVRYTATGLHLRRRWKNLWKYPPRLRRRGEVLVNDIPDGYEHVVREQFPDVNETLISRRAGKPTGHDQAVPQEAAADPLVQPAPAIPRWVESDLGDEQVVLPRDLDVDSFLTSDNDLIRSQHQQFRRFLEERGPEERNAFDFLAAVTRFRTVPNVPNAVALRACWLIGAVEKRRYRKALKEINQMLAERNAPADLFDELGRLVTAELREAYAEFTRDVQ
jgi:hypothetical protein